MKVLQKGNPIKQSLFNNPTEIDRSKELLKLIDEETECLRMLNILEQRLGILNNRILIIQEPKIEYYFKF